jgi:hypothetical protein
MSAHRVATVAMVAMFMTAYMKDLLRAGLSAQPALIYSRQVAGAS